MKKLLSLIFLLCISGVIFAQSTSPRFGTAVNQDNTGRVLTYAYHTITDAAGADTAIIAPNAYHSIYKVALLDSLVLGSPNISTSYLGDNITIIATAASGTPFIKFSGANWKVSVDSLSLSTNLRAVIRFVFDGSKWVQESALAQ